MASSLSIVAQGFRKNARLQLERMRRTHFRLAGSGRSVADHEFDLSSIKDYRAPSKPAINRELMLVHLHLRDWAATEKDFQLAVGRIVNNECVQDLAIRLGLNSQQARSKIHAARKYLGVAKRQ